MKHKRWIRAIHLLRDGELKQEEQQALEAHLSSCATCRSEALAVQLDWPEVMNHLDELPRLSDQKVITDSIMSAIETAEAPKHQKEEQSNWRLVDYFFGQNVRSALQVATLTLLVIFLFEQIQVVNSVQKFENRLQSQTTIINARPVLFPERFRKRMLLEIQHQIRNKLAFLNKDQSALQMLKFKEQKSEWHSFLNQFPVPGNKELLDINAIDALIGNFDFSRRYK